MFLEEIQDNREILLEKVIKQINPKTILADAGAFEVFIKQYYSHISLEDMNAKSIECGNYYKPVKWVKQNSGL
jgi:hypothetical protein